MQALYAQLLVGLINGSFYALLSLGLAVIFGMLNIINFAHGALYMMGAFVAFFMLTLAGLNYWWALIFAPVIVGGFGILLERGMLQWLTGHAEARKTLMEPLGRVWLAGEAVHETQWGTVNGAWESGTRAAESVLRYLDRGRREEPKPRSKRKKR